MKNIKNLLSLTFLILIAYSCEPEALPDTTITKNKDILADTGDQADVREDRKGN